MIRPYSIWYRFDRMKRTKNDNLILFYFIRQHIPVKSGLGYVPRETVLTRVYIFSTCTYGRYIPRKSLEGTYLPTIRYQVRALSTVVLMITVQKFQKIQFFLTVKIYTRYTRRKHNRNSTSIISN